MLKISKFEPSYVSIESDNFYSSLHNNPEFNQYKYTEDQLKETANSLGCSGNKEFTLHNYQEFVREYLGPRTPYNSLLMYWGVGTGKTCGAIQIAESLKSIVKEMGPYKKIYVIANQSLLDQFKDSLTKQCAGNEYIDESKKFQDSLINNYYEFKSYLRFAKLIDNYYKKGENILRETFSNCVFIIDEAHNLNSLDTLDTESNENTDEIKRFQFISNPKQAFQKLFQVVENSKLILLTGTPIRDNVAEELPTIINLLRGNDKRDLIDPDSIYKSPGVLDTDYILSKIKGYISYVKGENKLAFPQIIYKGVKIPALSKDIEGKTITTNKQLFTKAEICEMSDYQYAVYILQNILRDNSANLLSLKNSAAYIAPCNFVVPFDEPINEKNINKRIGTEGFNLTVSTTISNGLEIYSLKQPIFDSKNIDIYSPKILKLLKNIEFNYNTHYIFSDYIKIAITPIAIALYYFGYQLAEISGKPEFYESVDSISKKPVKLVYNLKSVAIVNDPVNVPEPRCYCGKLRSNHNGINHEFRQGLYVIHTGSAKYDQMSESLRKIFIDRSNFDGHLIKCYIGSKVSSEGINYRYISNVHIFNIWYNFARIEQVIGRASRNCSHAGINDAKVNVFYYVSVRPKNISGALQLLPENYRTIARSYYDRETADQNVFRSAEEKYRETRAIYRLFKIAAVDCYNNYLWNKIPTNSNDFSINYPEEDYSPQCDFDTCDYKCIKDAPFTPKKVSDLASYLTINKIQKDNFISKIIKFIDNLTIPSFDIRNLLKSLGMSSKDISTTRYNSLLEALNEIIYSNKYTFEFNGIRGRFVYTKDYIITFKPLVIPENNELPLYYYTNPVFTRGPKLIQIKPIFSNIASDDSRAVNISSIEIKSDLGTLEEIIKNNKSTEMKVKMFNYFDTLHNTKFPLTGLTTFDAIYETISKGFNELIKSDYIITQTNYKKLNELLNEYMELSYRKQKSVTDFFISSTVITRTPATNSKSIKTHKYFNFEFSFVCRIKKSTLKVTEESKQIDIVIPLTSKNNINSETITDNDYTTIIVRFTRFNFTDLYTEHDKQFSFDILSPSNNSPELPIVKINGREQGDFEIISNYPELITSDIRNYVASCVQWSMDTFLKTGILHASEEANNIYGYYAVDIESIPKTGTKIVNQEINKDNINKRNKPTGRACKSITIRDLDKYIKLLNIKEKPSPGIETYCDVINNTLRTREINRKPGEKRYYYYYGDNDFNVYTSVTDTEYTF